MDPSWMLSAKCATQKMDPRLFDADNPEPAAILCAGCKTMRECAEWYSQPIDISGVVEQFNDGYSPDLETDLVMPSGVKAAGVNLGET